MSRLFYFTPSVWYVGLQLIPGARPLRTHSMSGLVGMIRNGLIAFSDFVPWALFFLFFFFESLSTRVQVIPMARLSPQGAERGLKGK